MASAGALYTPEVLALAASLADFPLAADLPLRGEARSQACGSAIELGLALGPSGAISRIGIRANACAVGQAAAAIFAAGAAGQSSGGLSRALDEIEAWLGGAAGLPGWPGLGAIAAAREFPGRHGAIVLAWKAARAALASA